MLSIPLTKITSSIYTNLVHISSIVKSLGIGIPHTILSHKTKQCNTTNKISKTNRQKVLHKGEFKKDKFGGQDVREGIYVGKSIDNKSLKLD